jgi:rubredoxin
MKPFDPDATCPKCGEKMGARYQELREHVIGGIYHKYPEHLVRICNNCGYVGDEEAPLDAKPET